MLTKRRGRARQRSQALGNHRQNAMMNGDIAERDRIDTVKAADGRRVPAKDPDQQVRSGSRCARI